MMDSSYNRSSQSSRYIEVGPNGEVLHQSSIVPPDVVSDYLTSQRSMAYNGTSSNAEWSNYPYQTSNKKQWWQKVGPFTPYRTTYQDYGRPKNQFDSMSNVFYTQPNIYSQGSNMNGTNWNSFTTTSYPGQGSTPYNLPRPPE